MTTATPPRAKCPHFSLLGAAFTIHTKGVGSEWTCNCGAVFVVVSDTTGGPKRLERRPNVRG